MTTSAGQPYFSTPERCVALVQAAEAWVGTPFRHGSAVRQAGASCVGAVDGVMRDVGFAVPEFPLGTPTNWCKHQKESLQEKWMDSHPECLQPIDLDVLRMGDVVGFKVGLCMHHMGIILGDYRFFQCSESLGAVILSRSEPRYRERLVRAWRPVEV